MSHVDAIQMTCNDASHIIFVMRGFTHGARSQLAIRCAEVQVVEQSSPMISLLIVL